MMILMAILVLAELPNHKTGQACLSIQFLATQTINSHRTSKNYIHDPTTIPVQETVFLLIIVNTFMVSTRPVVNGLSLTVCQVISAEGPRLDEIRL